MIEASKRKRKREKENRKKNQNAEKIETKKKNIKNTTLIIKHEDKINRKDRTNQKIRPITSKKKYWEEKYSKKTAVVRIPENPISQTDRS